MDVTWNWPVRLIAIYCWGSMISVKMWLERVSNVYIGSSSIWGVPGVLVNLMFFRICFMCPFAADMEGGTCFVRSTVRLVHVLKWHFLMAGNKVFCTGMNSVAWKK